jgi:hypothetical protein
MIEKRGRKSNVADLYDGVAVTVLPLFEPCTIKAQKGFVSPLMVPSSVQKHL